MFYFNCPSCKKGIKASTEQIGTRGRCPKCNATLTVPAPPPPATPASPSHAPVPTLSAPSTVAPASPSPAPTSAVGGPSQGEWKTLCGAHPSPTPNSGVGTARKGKSEVFEPSALPPEVRLRRLLTEHGHGVCADLRRCEGWIRDICGEKTKEAHLLVVSLKGRIPADLLESMPVSAMLPTLLQRLCSRLEDSFGISDSAAAWAVNAWALALGLVTDDNLPAGVAPKLPAGNNGIPLSTAMFAKSSQTVTIAELVTGPERYLGQRLKILGHYCDFQQRGCLFYIEEQGKELPIKFSGLPEKQMVPVLRPEKSDGQPVVVEGVVIGGAGAFKIIENVFCNPIPWLLQASTVFVDGVPPRPPRHFKHESITLEELVVSSSVYHGRTIQVMGEMIHPYGDLGRGFRLKQADLYALVDYSKLLKRERISLMGRPNLSQILVEGVCRICDGVPEITATRYGDVTR